MAEMVEAGPALRERLVDGDPSLGQVTRDICRPLEGKPTRLWYGGFAVAVGFLVLGIIAVTYQTLVGIGTWGLSTHAEELPPFEDHRQLRGSSDPVLAFQARL